MSGSYAGENGKFPVLILTSQGDSHPFQQRTIVLDDVIKVGRSVARAKPADNNAIFDCKVLSRSHALIWHKFGRFWLRDTNSSNGTFVNNTRVPKPTEPNSDREIFSGDIIRFGVDVVEHETTHGCIIARVTLFHANGVEAKQHVDRMSVANGSVGIETLYAEQVFRLAHSVGEAMFREQVLERKLESLNRLLQDTRKSSEAGWQAMLNEERLLRKLDLYESQLAIMKQDFPEDSLQAQLRQVLDEKCSLEKASELMLARILCEKTEALTKVTNLECRLSDSERECARLRQDCEATQEAYQSITTEHQSKMMELVRLEQQLQDIQTEKENLEALLRERTKEAEVLQENLAKKTKVSKPSSNLFLGESDKETNFALNGMDNGPFENPEHIGDRLSSINRQVRELRDKVDVTDQLQSSLNQRADLVRDEIALSDLTELDRYCELQERLATSEANFEQMLDSTSDGISMHLMDSVRQFHQSMQLIKSLQEELASLAQLKSTLSRELKQTTTDQIKSSRPPSEISDPRLPNQSDEVYPLIDEDVQEINDHGFSNTLNRARSITARVAACHARAEASLSSYCAEQRRQTDMCNSSGTAPDETGNNLSKVEESVVHSTGLVRLVPDGLQTKVESQSSIDESEVFKLREDLRTAQSEVETYKQMAETFKQQDVVKSDLLLSFREECDTLRKRIASIEADVITSREDHQRLIAEARKTRSEADELRQERDALNDQVNTCNQRIEQLQSALRTTLLGPAATSAVNSTAKSTSTAHLETDAQSTLISHPGTSSTAQPPVSLSSGPGSMVSLFAIIPIMVLLCAVMMYIFSLFVR